MIKCKINKFSYGKRTVLENINISIPVGKIHCITGDNGNGKSTFLHLLSGAIKYNEGVNIKHDFNRVVCAFQSPVILNRSVSDNLLHICKVFKVNNPEQKINSALKQVNLFKYKNQPAPTLSGGQKMRLQIARLIVVNADLWVLDEPFTGLDKKSCEELIKILKKYNKNGATILIATHNHIAKKICDKTYNFQNKKIIAKKH